MKMEKSDGSCENRPLFRHKNSHFNKIKKEASVREREKKRLDL
jgi:hypothetical protein